MTNSFLYNTPAILISVFLFAGIIIFHILGFKVISYQKRKNSEFTTSGIGALEGALLGLLSLLLAFHLINPHLTTMPAKAYWCRSPMI